MTHRPRLIAGLGLLAAVLVVLQTVPAAAGRAAGDPAIERWASSVWDAALRGDSARLEAAFDGVPAEGEAAEPAARFRAQVASFRSHRTAAAAARREQRDEALAEMQKSRDEDNLPAALRQAVAAQTYSEDLDSAFDDQEIMGLVRWAEGQVPIVEREREWLDAQELLYLLRTFYEDTERNDAFDRFDEELGKVNRRVELLARYVPRRLHDMRNERATRLGEEPFGEFNPATAVDWRERLDGVSPTMLKNALATSASEHIESAGWRPLLEGGLDALELVSTTCALADTFPTLADPQRVASWIEAIDKQRERLARTDDARLSRWYFDGMFKAMLVANQDTIQLPDAVLVQEFGDGATGQLDTYSEIIWPAKLRRFQQQTQGNFIGVGILIRHNDKREIMIVNPLEGTPAYLAGVKPHDVIEEVNGDPTVGWSLNDAVDRITGPKGSVVKLGLRREGEEEPVEIEIRRDEIKIRSVKGWWKKDIDEHGEPVWDWFIDRESQIAYVRLTQFTEDSFGDLRQAWREINAVARPAGLVFDLRHNPGGLLTSAVQISNLFVNEGNIVTGEDKHGNRAWDQSARKNYAEFSGVPTVVLINRGSASASEIVAGCLQAHGAAILVGERTFGKGSVQTIHHVAREGRLKLTTQYYRLPAAPGEAEGRLVHRRPGATVWGVDPDIEVAMSVKQVTDAINLRQAAETIPMDDAGALDPENPERPNVSGLLTDGIDPQLATAMLILQAQAMAEQTDARHALRAREPMRIQ